MNDPQARTLREYNKILANGIRSTGYVNSFTDVEHVCKNEGHVFQAQPASVLISKRCFVCPTEAHKERFKNLKVLYDGVFTFTCLARSTGTKNRLEATVKCKACKHVFVDKLSTRMRCPVCKEVAVLRRTETTKDRKQNTEST